MPKAIQPITLSESEQTALRLVINQGTHSARMIKRAQILLHSHAGKKPQEIASWLNTCLSTVYSVRQLYLDKGLDAPGVGGCQFHRLRVRFPSAHGKHRPGRGLDSISDPGGW